MVPARPGARFFGAALWPRKSRIRVAILSFLSKTATELGSIRCQEHMPARSCNAALEVFCAGSVGVLFGLCAGSCAGVFHRRTPSRVCHAPRGGPSGCAGRRVLDGNRHSSVGTGGAGGGVGREYGRNQRGGRACGPWPCGADPDRRRGRGVRGLVSAGGIPRRRNLRTAQTEHRQNRRRILPERHRTTSQA